MSAMDTRLLEAHCEALTLATAQVEAAAGYLTGRHLVAQITEAMRLAVAANDSPFVNRAQAAARWGCSVDAIDRAARAGQLVPMRGGVNPLFEKAQGDAAIRSGTWKTEHRKQKPETQLAA